MTTTTPIDRAAINRRNAQKSTGPRTPEGKNRSKFNAVKHGMTAETLVLPDEDANILQIRLETWIHDLQPRNEVEQAWSSRPCTPPGSWIGPIGRRWPGCAASWNPCRWKRRAVIERKPPPWAVDSSAIGI